MNIRNESKYLNEIGTAVETFIFGNGKFAIYNCPSTNDDYIIKFCKIENNSFVAISRISMKEPKYINCEYSNYILTKEELSEFINALHSDRRSMPYRYDDEAYPYTSWQFIIEESNFVYKTENINKFIPKDLSIPDYTLLPTRD